MQREGKGALVLDGLHEDRPQQNLKWLLISPPKRGNLGLVGAWRARATVGVTPTVARARQELKLSS